MVVPNYRGKKVRSEQRWEAKSQLLEYELFPSHIWNERPECPPGSQWRMKVEPKWRSRAMQKRKAQLSPFFFSSFFAHFRRCSNSVLRNMIWLLWTSLFSTVWRGQLQGEKVSKMGKNAVRSKNNSKYKINLQSQLQSSALFRELQTWV